MSCFDRDEVSPFVVEEAERQFSWLGLWRPQRNTVQHNTIPKEDVTTLHIPHSLGRDIRLGRQVLRNETRQAERIFVSKGYRKQARG
jgi:hypothetical protein